LAKEVAIGAVAAISSLVAGLVALTQKLMRSKHQSSESVTVTIQRGSDTIEKKGMLKPDDASKILDMVETRSDSTVHAK
jgi:hypothetical protein